jgi:RNA recognition motif-containing protein
MSVNIYVGNLSYAVNDAELDKTFSEFGEVVSAKVIADKISGRSKGFGFVEMQNAEDANKAVKELDGKELMGRPVKVNFAKPKSENSRF